MRPWFLEKNHNNSQGLFQALIACGSYCYQKHLDEIFLKTTTEQH